MDYYEELGLRASATEEEIRSAYRMLARMLHPDGQQDEEARALAECQMRRLNQMVETLSDPAKRAAYDRRSVRVRKRRRSRWSRAALSRTAIVVWASSAAIVILILAFFLRDEVTRQPASPRVAEQGQSAHIADLEREIERLQRELRQARRTGTHE